MFQRHWPSLGLRAYTSHCRVVVLGREEWARAALAGECLTCYRRVHKVRRRQLFSRLFFRASCRREADRDSVCAVTRLSNLLGSRLTRVHFFLHPGFLCTTMASAIARSILTRRKLSLYRVLLVSLTPKRRSARLRAPECALQIHHARDEPDNDRGWHCSVEEEGG